MKSIHARIRPAVLATAVMTAAAAFLLLLPGQWGVAYGQTAGAVPAPPSDVVSQPVSAASGGVVSTPPGAGDAVLTVVIPPGALPADAVVTLDAPDVVLTAGGSAQLPPGVPPAPAAPAGATNVIAAVFAMSATAFNGQPITVFNAPVTVQVTVPPEVLAVAGGNTGAITLQFFNTASGSWQAVPATIANGVLTAQVMHFSLWAMVVTRPITAQQPPAAATPGAAVPRPPATGSAGLHTARNWESAVAAGALFVVLLGGATARRLVSRK